MRPIKYYKIDQMCVIVELRPIYIYTQQWREDLESFVEFQKRETTFKMLEGKAKVEETDMPLKMQIKAMSYAYHALDLYDVYDCKSIAAHIKKVHYFNS